ncbi:hypothetical protein [Prosthecobacter sp.]|uniref:hypothetical protein n=1 Tax=Prosthecobacter sp. TaxID=1965333 RepID=UPI003784B8CA
MSNRRNLLLLLLAGAALVPAAAFAKEKRCRLTLVFTEPSFKWSRVITYRDDFHLFLDANPFSTVTDVIYVAGTVYPKEGADHVSLTIGTSMPNKENGGTLGAVKHVGLPKDGRIGITPIGGHFKTCTARIEFIP